MKVYIVNHKGDVHDKQSLMIIISSFSSCIPLLSQFRKSVGPVRLCTSTTGTSW